MDRVFLYGKKLLEDEPDIIKSRRFINFNLDSKIDDIIMMYGLEKYKKKLVERNSSKDFEMGWHQDDVAFHRNSKSHCNQYNKDNIKPYCKDKPPIYTLILYYSSIGEDFDGGEFCFVDEKIRPKKGMGILFDSREIHRVNRVKWGERKVMVIKLYN